MNKEVKLKNKNDFIDVLSNYKISEHAKNILHSVHYVVLVGPAAAGRNTIIGELVKNGKYEQVVSDTTRPPKYRDGRLEQEGVNYYFRDEEDLLEDLKHGEFLEAELIHNQQVSGTSIRELQKIQKEGKIGINEVEFGGAKNVLLAKPDSLVIAILPLSFKIWLDRFQKREVISDIEFKSRVKTAQKVLDFIKSEPRVIVVINKDYKEAAKDIDRILSGIEQTPLQLDEIAIVVEDFRLNVSKLIKSF